MMLLGGSTYTSACILVCGLCYRGIGSSALSIILGCVRHSWDGVVSEHLVALAGVFLVEWRRHCESEAEALCTSGQIDNSWLRGRYSYD